MHGFEELNRNRTLHSCQVHRKKNIIVMYLFSKKYLLKLCKIVYFNYKNQNKNTYLLIMHIV